MNDINLLESNGVNVKKSLEIFGDMATYDETLQVFLAEVDGKLDKIKKFKQEDNMDDYAIVVHSLKSDAKYFGFETLAEIAYQHELESKANHIDFINENYHKLLNEANRIITLVKKYLKVTNAFSGDTNINTVSDSNQKILIVDDSDIIRTVIQRIFNDSYEVLSANDGKEAIEVVDKYKNDNLVAVLLDLNMPNVDGFAVLDYFKSLDLFNKFSVSIITGNDDAEEDRRAFEYPIVDILKKPFNEANIKNIVEKTVNKL